MGAAERGKTECWRALEDVFRVFQGVAGRCRVSQEVAGVVGSGRERAGVECGSTVWIRRGDSDQVIQIRWRISSSGNPVTSAISLMDIPNAFILRSSAVLRAGRDRHFQNWNDNSCLLSCRIINILYTHFYTPFILMCVC